MTSQVEQAQWRARPKGDQRRIVSRQVDDPGLLEYLGKRRAALTCSV
jgi:hypothetical protein